MSASLTINLKRASKVYHEGETIAGVVVVESSSDVRHEGLTLLMEGSISLQFSSKNVGILDAFSNNLKERGTRLVATLPEIVPTGFKLRINTLLSKRALSDPIMRTQSGPHLEERFPRYCNRHWFKFGWILRPISLVQTSVELAAPGKIPVGVTEIPFEIPLRARTSAAGGPALLESYHGVFVNVMYALRANMKRSFLNKPLNTSCQFFVQYRHQEPPPPKPVRCEISPTSIRAGGTTGTRTLLPHFQIYAEIDSTVCALDKPLTGKIRVDECSVPIKSIELQLVRVETCGSADAYTRDATEIQNIQVGDGEQVRARDIPLYMVLPRLFTCPTTTTHNFKIEFELNIAVIFEDDYLVTENFPILLLRCR